MGFSSFDDSKKTGILVEMPEASKLDPPAVTVVPKYWMMFYKNNLGFLVPDFLNCTTATYRHVPRLFLCCILLLLPASALSVLLSYFAIFCVPSLQNQACLRETLETRNANT